MTILFGDYSQYLGGIEGMKSFVKECDMFIKNIEEEE